MPKRSAGGLDDDRRDDHTDELPVLLEEVTFADEELEPLRTDFDARAVPVERPLPDRDKRVLELESDIAALRRSLDERTEAERRLATELTARDARAAEQAGAIERLQAAAGERSAEDARQRAEGDALRRELEALRGELASKTEVVDDRNDLLEEKAALAAYIAGRRSWWDEAQATQTRLAAQARELEAELETRAQRLASADALAAQESDRAIALRAELVAATRRSEQLERELKVARNQGATDPSPPHGAAANGGEPSGVATESLVLLEGEIEYKRRQMSARLVELRERDQKLLEAARELERLQRELAASRAELSEGRARVAWLEQTIADKERELGARDARIAMLHENLDQRLRAIQKLNAGEFELPRHELASNQVEKVSEKASPPALICLTGDGPRLFALTEKSVTVGRGSQCGLRIRTQFVSREHARIILRGGALFIEDLGSRNGIFVNSVRVERHALAQGDLITIGDSQFRFVESLAH